ncbi:MAG: hypothetical protein AAGG51_11280 [Cyanobacteria bacterium P01_G01_bin.54]
MISLHGLLATAIALALGAIALLMGLVLLAIALYRKAHFGKPLPQQRLVALFMGAMTTTLLCGLLLGGLQLESDPLPQWLCHRFFAAPQGVACNLGKGLDESRYGWTTAFVGLGAGVGWLWWRGRRWI